MNDAVFSLATDIKNFNEHLCSFATVDTGKVVVAINTTRRMTCTCLLYVVCVLIFIVDKMVKFKFTVKFLDFSSYLKYVQFYVFSKFYVVLICHVVIVLWATASTFVPCCPVRLFTIVNCFQLILFLEQINGD